ncbi:MAG TPA: thiolase family protein [Acidimicrobiales bacterium]|nr:thiolase family protein [Acidimicrobiales bacterium]
MVDVAEHRAVISGIGISRIGRKTGIPGLVLTEEACRAALADAGLDGGSVEGLASMGDTPLDDVAVALGVEPAWTSGAALGNGGLLAPVMAAVSAVAERRVRHALVYRTVRMVGGAIGPGAGNEGGAAPPPDRGGARVMGDMAPLLTYHAYSAANWVAMHCRRHMYLYGTTKEQLGHLAINSRRYAALNPLATYRQPITMEDYLSARPISEPFGLLDCDVPVDGSIAVVVSTAGYGVDAAHGAVRVEAVGTAPGFGGWDQRPDYPKMASMEAAAEMWGRTDLKPADVDLAELYDGFTFLTLAWLEALGFCDTGEAGPFVEGGSRITLGGDLPLNTYGGQLSAGRMHGYWVLHEACLQLRGQAGARQVDGAEVAVVSNGGGPIAGCILLTRP